ncbi:lipid II:glycine glycyltransferase FemX [Paenibacillus hodogayensis]|uniref:Lipid II:glycine glycyltransferase n=1 Tax=Paenibacillus hodogayensis TaxID=279208 RepID=A0ABV5W8D6_9BACL
MSFEILAMADKEAWERYILLLPNADVYFTWGYCKIYEDNGEGLARMFVYSDQDGIICYPFLLRKINDLPIIRGIGIEEDCYDISTPYGYGGPLSNVTDSTVRKRLFASFSDAFGQYCRSNNIVTEFVRFHPIIKNYLDYEDVGPVFLRNTISIDLFGTDQEIMQRFSGENRNRIRKAKKEGLQFVCSDETNLDHFIRLYYSTMDRNNANSYYYFSDNFFLNTVELLSGHVKLFEVRLNDQVLVSSLFMYYNKYAHYHFMGANKEYLRLAPVNLLISEAAMWAKEQGCQYLHLGGGYIDKDSLYRFKRTFNEETALDYYVGKKVHRADIYNDILTRLSIDAKAEYFPAYRNPSLQRSHLLNTTTGT